MQYLLDTNAWIMYLKDPDSEVRKRLLTVSPQDIVTCSIVVAELLHGAEKYGNRHKRVTMVQTLLAPFNAYRLMKSMPPITQPFAMNWRFAEKS